LPRLYFVISCSGCLGLCGAKFLDVYIFVTYLYLINFVGCLV